MANMKLTASLPVPALRGYVRYFQHRTAHIPATTVLYAIPARTEQLMEFYLRDLYIIRSRKSGTTSASPQAVVVGPSTHRHLDLVLRGHFEVFTIHFKPSGFHRLFRVPMPELTDQGHEARAVIGPVASELQQRLAEATSFDERVGIATTVLLRHAAGRDVPDAISAAADALILQRGDRRVSHLAADAGLSVRQFERRFLQQVGVSPRSYGGIVRFQAALTCKLSDASRSWTQIAHEFGYHDHMHLVHDFNRFSGEGPTDFLRNFYAMPEPW